MQVGPTGGGARFSIIAKRLMELAAAILVHCPPAAGGRENACNHVIERRCPIAAGADENSFQHRECIVVSL
jgi:ornithine carbamoyltransferase